MSAFIKCLGNVGGLTAKAGNNEIIIYRMYFTLLICKLFACSTTNPIKNLKECEVRLLFIIK